MAIVKVQNSASVAASTATLPVASTAGNLLVALLCGTSSGLSGWTFAINDSANGSEIWYYENNPGGLSSFAFGTSCVFIIEYSGVATSASLDTTGVRVLGSTPVTATTTGNVSVANSLAVGAVSDTESKSGTTTISQSSSWTDIANNGATSQTTHLLATNKSNPTSGTTLSLTGASSSMNLSAVSVAIAVFKPASGTNSNFLRWFNHRR